MNFSNIKDLFRSYLTNIHKLKNIKTANEYINNLPKVKSAFFDKKLGFLATLPEFCFEKYKIELESQEEIFFKNKHLKIISSIEKSFTLDLEEKINQLIVHKKIPNSATLDVRFADQIILKGREGHG